MKGCSGLEVMYTQTIKKATNTLIIKGGFRI